MAMTDEERRAGAAELVRKSREHAAYIVRKRTGQRMNDEDRAKLCADLRAAGSLIADGAARKAFNDAAEEIELLQERCERLRKEMVKWRSRCVPQENGND
jgi:hypothetical protein